MMCHIMRVRSPQALTHAVALGRAMQLTNISRDIQEDFRNKRIYLPMTWLQSAQLNESNFFDIASRPQLQKVVNRLISKARELYQVGAKGLEYLPLRSAWAVCIAMTVYRDIGEQVSKSHAFDQRVIVSRSKKLFLLFRASFSLIPLILYRISHPFKATDQLGLWRES
jgi:phytoene synthase